MTDQAARDVVRRFYEALASRDKARIAPFIAEDCDWIYWGPIDVLPWLGQRRGRDAVLAVFDEIPRVLKVESYVPEWVVVDGDSAAALIALRGRMVATGNVYAIRFAQFIRLRDGQAVQVRAVIDSLDAAEQALGHALTPPTGPSRL